MLCFLIGGILLLSGCRQKQEKVVDVQYISKFPLDTLVELTEHHFEHGWDNRASFVKMGNHLIWGLSYYRMRIYSYPELKFIREQQMPSEKTIFYHNDRLYWGTAGEFEVYRMNENDSLVVESTCSLPIPDYTYGVKWLDEENYIYPDSYLLPGLNEFHIVNARTKETTSYGSYPTDPSYFKKVSDFKSAYRHGIFLKPNREALLVSYGALPRFRIYNKQFELQKDVYFDFPPGNYKSIPPKWEERIGHLRSTNVTDEYIYFLKWHYRYEEELKPYSEIFVVDWAGNPVARYRVNALIYCFFLDEENNQLFGTSAKGSRIDFFTLKLIHSK